MTRDIKKDSARQKDKNKRIRQENLREQLAAQGHVQHVVDILDNLNDENCHIEPEIVTRKKIVLDTKLKLIGKYLPDLKAIEVEGNISGKSHEEWLKDLE
jgi:hypothetical protein